MIESGTMFGGRYTIIRHIGAGGMQDVYLANDSYLNKNVALKTPQLGQKTKRFQASAVIAARVNHHNVAKTIDYFEEGDQVFLIEEFVDGQTLEQKTETREFLDPHLGARTLHLLAKGINASHKQGVMHRDLKPSNIMVDSSAGINYLKITDFGIATLTEEVFEEEANSGDLTRSTSGTIKGALPFMAPEMMFRKPGDKLTCAIDIWSIGAMMFKLLTGEYPFGVYLDAAVNVKTNNRVAWPAFMTTNKQFSPLATELQRIIDRCLSPQPESRPTAQDLIDECQNLCYMTEERFEAEVYRMIQNNYSGFASNSQHEVFFSIHSVYGKSKPSANSMISYSKFSGSPKDRAHPVVVM
ncbi:serine/threonine-protein kinase [Grimontia sp. NTOU-MAR1]|uniref:serine/threonine-protein kinase n=1 Tax=Grimontia sp. NTOU-MAR1 TaxID=3111011 RepID=UPI002DB721CC|nr:serine/threonine-protein kinase [Grimontia sp. NTOU-MAR1]WRV98564.1 serine/threonine-protein kinase [Grimontia sp. NTOU-MAR1]